MPLGAGIVFNLLKLMVICQLSLPGETAYSGGSRPDWGFDRSKNGNFREVSHNLR